MDVSSVLLMPKPTQSATFRDRASVLTLFLSLFDPLRRHARPCATAVRFVFCLKKRTALILVCSEGLATHLDTKKDQHRASPQYCLPRSSQTDPLDGLRSACRPTWQ